jgi:hypothetical protein
MAAAESAKAPCAAVASRRCRRRNRPQRLAWSVAVEAEQSLLFRGRGTWRAWATGCEWCVVGVVVERARQQQNAPDPLIATALPRWPTLKVAVAGYRPIPMPLLSLNSPQFLPSAREWRL